jgi:hypothetical protein
VTGPAAEPYPTLLSGRGNYAVGRDGVWRRTHLYAGRHCRLILNGPRIRGVAGTSFAGLAYFYLDHE